MSDFFKFEYIDPKNIILNNNNEDYGTFIQGNKSGIQISTFQQPTELTFKTDFIGGFVQDVISFRRNVGVGATGQGRIFSPSINDDITVDFPSDSIIIYQTGQGYGNVSSKGPYLRLGYHNIISEVPDSRLGIGTLFPVEKVHISGGNLRVEDSVFAKNLIYNTGNQTISGLKFFVIRPQVNGTGVLLSGEAYPSNNPSGFITGIDTSSFYPRSNPSGFITGVNLSSYATIANLNAVSGALQTQINNISGGGSITGDYYPNSNPSGFITGVDLSNYATNSNLFLTGKNLDNKINSLSGYVEEENILVFTAELPSGQESVFLTYPFSLGTSPSSITCSFQNTVDNVIYNYTLGQITQSGFYANFSDILSNSGYLLKVNVKK